MRNYGGAAYRAPAPARGPFFHQHFGFLIASCEKADLRPMPQGILVYGEEGAFPRRNPPPTRPRAEVMDEVYAAVVEGVPPLHSGAWSLATMEVCSRDSAIGGGAEGNHAPASDRGALTRGRPREAEATGATRHALFGGLDKSPDQVRGWQWPAEMIEILDFYAARRSVAAPSAPARDFSRCSGPDVDSFGGDDLENPSRR